jgi:hypothetical protein
MCSVTLCGWLTFPSGQRYTYDPPMFPIKQATDIEQGIKRLQFHQGLNYRYASWQPIESKGLPPTTRPPYYGQIMVASAIGQSKDTRIVNIPLSEDTESAYAIYNGDQLSKLVVTNLRAFNQTTLDRPHREYKFHVPAQYRSARVESLIGPGSDALDNITFGGISYDHALNEGRPVQRMRTKRQGLKMGCLLSLFRTLPLFCSLYDLLHLGCAGTPYISTMLYIVIQQIW